MKYVVFDDFFAVLSNKQRVRILQFLNEAGASTVSSISKALEAEQSAVSHCMKRLLDCHFVEVEPKGKERLYRINNKTVKPLFQLIDQHVRSYCVKGCDHWE
ncbi:MAG: metalloregulator ArsR/SmtB family transcription factor [Candidatus Saccharibacteria bacterium]